MCRCVDVDCYACRCRLYFRCVGVDCVALRCVECASCRVSVACPLDCGRLFSVRIWASVRCGVGQRGRSTVCRLLAACVLMSTVVTVRVSMLTVDCILCVDCRLSTVLRGGALSVRRAVPALHYRQTVTGERALCRAGVACSLDGYIDCILCGDVDVDCVVRVSMSTVFYVSKSTVLRGGASSVRCAVPALRVR